MPLKSEPIFLIGAARSGTKFLRDCLRADTRIRAVPFDVNYIWRFGQADEQGDALSPGALSDKQRAFIRQSILKQAKPRDGDILLEKSVSNSLRVPYVEAIFPGARYIHLIRDGRDVTKSAMKEWHAPPSYSRLFEKLGAMPWASWPYLVWYAGNILKGLGKKKGEQSSIWGPRYPGIYDDVGAHSLQRVCATQWLKSVEFAQRDLSSIPASRVFTIRYEELVSDIHAIERLADELELDRQTIKEKWSETVRPGVQKHAPKSLNSENSEIDELLGPQLKALGYK